MDNQTHNSENAWVDKKVAILVPPADWHPDSKRALAQFMKRRDRREAGSPRWIQLSMAAAVLASIGLVVTLLPWHALWEGTKPGKKSPPELSTLTTPEVVPEPAPLSPGPFPPAPKPPARPQPLAPAAVAAIQQTAPTAPEQGQKPVEHVGPGVTPPRVIPPVSEPDYTDEARQAHIQGGVVLSVIIRADGTGKVDRVIRSLGYGLDQKAIEVVEKWRFAPATKDGQPVDVEIQATVNFHLY